MGNNNNNNNNNINKNNNSTKNPNYTFSSRPPATEHPHNSRNSIHSQKNKRTNKIPSEDIALQTEEELLHNTNTNGVATDEFIGQGEAHRAVHRYTATNDDEISLSVGDVVYVLEKCDDEWYVGTNAMTGCF